MMRSWSRIVAWTTTNGVALMHVWRSMVNQVLLRLMLKRVYQAG